MSSASLDDLDRAVLHHLQEDARRAVTDIADDLDVSDNTVRNRMQAMEEAGVIGGYRVEVDYDVADVQHYYMFVCSARVSEREALAAEAREYPRVTEVITLMTGNHNVLVIGASEGKDEISDLASAIDELGLTVEREHLIRDHVRQPYSGFDPPGYLTRK